MGPIDVADDDSGILGIQPESEGKMWADHPTIDPNAPENLEPPPSPARQVSPPTPHTAPRIFAFTAFGATAFIAKCWG